MATQDRPLDIECIEKVPGICGERSDRHGLAAPFTATGAALVEPDDAHGRSQFVDQFVPEIERAAEAADQHQGRAVTGHFDPGLCTVA